MFYNLLLKILSLKEDVYLNEDSIASFIVGKNQISVSGLQYVGIFMILKKYHSRCLSAGRFHIVHWAESNRVHISSYLFSSISYHCLDQQEEKVPKSGWNWTHAEDEKVLNIRCSFPVWRLYTTYSGCPVHWVFQVLLYIGKSTKELGG